MKRVCTQAGRWLLVTGTIYLLLPVRADAHLPTVGLGPVYDGIFHFLMSPEDLIPVIAVALLSGQRGPSVGRRVLWLVPVAWFLGGLTGMLAGSGRGSALTFVSFLLFGGLVAANAKVSLRVISVLSAFLGFFHGYLNGVGINFYNDGVYIIFGIALTIFMVVALFSSFVIPLRRQWALIVVRVAGSWIAASGLLLVGWTLRNPQ